MISIFLKDLKFRSLHGVYAEEKILGGDYIVKVEVRYVPGKDLIANIEDTVNYESLFSIVKAYMDIPTPLIETVAMKIVNHIFSEFGMINYVEATIEKCNPPIEKFVGNVAVKYHLERN